MCRALTSSVSIEGRELARRFVADRWAAIVEHWSEARNEPSPKEVLDAACHLSRPLLGLIEASLLIGDSEQHAEILRTVMAPDAGLPLAGLLHLLRAAHDGRPRRDVAKRALAPVHEHCAQALGDLLVGPVRDRDDWSIRVSGQCTCQLCDKLVQFLRAPKQRQLEWPLAKNRRAHVHGIIERYDFPVSHVTRREGSPFTLILTKTEALLEREAAERARWDGDLRWLTKTASVF